MLANLCTSALHSRLQGSDLFKNKRVESSSIDSVSKNIQSSINNFQCFP